jgi:hypothetical protein
MAQQANITVFDGAATPVVHTLVADGVSVEGATVTAAWKETLAGVPDYAQIRFWEIKQTLASGVVKVTARVEVPIMESISGQNASGYTAPPKVANVERSEMVGYYSPRSTETNRRLGEQLLLNWAQNVTTTVTPVTTGPVAELFQKLIMVS